jgi:hypothetical protein
MLDGDAAVRVKDGLFAQKYNLLLGAGVSLDSTDRLGKALLRSEDLRQKLCNITGSRENSPLWRVAGLLTPHQIRTHITEQFFGSKAGPTLRLLTRFPWKTAYTLNVDDALENAYETEIGRVQQVVSVNYTRPFEAFRNPNELAAIHLHGFVRLPEDQYVFSLQEYVGLQRKLNPWVHTLSNLIVTEPFIIAGTSLFEPDLEFFFGHRASNSPVLARAPSLLIEPYPDAGTARDCERLGIQLVKATLAEFLEWTLANFGSPPTPLSLREPRHAPRTIGTNSIHTGTAFWHDFDFVPPAAKSSEKMPLSVSPFIFGRAPSWDDVRNSRDVPLRGQLAITDEIRRWQATSEVREVLCLEGFAGSGKSTDIRRALTELAQHGLQVFFLRARDGFDTESAAKYFSNVVDPILIGTESLAEHGDQLVELIGRLDQKKRVCILGAERAYRMRLVREIFAPELLKIYSIQKWQIDETTELVKRYASLGLIGDARATANPREFAEKISKDPVSEAICRILNDFRPLRQIAASLWNDTIASGRTAYLTVALAHYCHPAGLRREIICGAFPGELVVGLSDKIAPLRICVAPDDDEFLVPANATVAKLLLEEMARQKPKRLVEIAAQLANAIAPYVSREAIRQRTAEARLAGRLFDADGVLPELWGDSFHELYDLTLDRWKWNSRYWEQLALYVSSKDRKLAVQHARHAVSIERHPFPMTTLAKILFSAVLDEEPPRRDFFSEALTLMEDTLKIEQEWERGRTRTAYRTLIDGSIGYLEAGGSLTIKQRRFLETAAADALKWFAVDANIPDRAQRLVELIQVGSSV